jgi:hypothetical protein
MLKKKIKCGGTQQIVFGGNNLIEKINKNNLGVHKFFL